jgi:quercetin dioxygenase-like cupin family protein
LNDENSKKMTKKKRTIGCTIAVFALIAIVIPDFALAQVPGVKRNDLQRYDLSASGREVIQARVEINPGVVAPRHSHPGEEIIYVLEGVLEYKIDGKPAVTLTAGDVYFIPAGAIHSAKNVGKGKAAELATYIVENGKPLLVIAQ